MRESRWAAWLAVFFTILGVFRIVASYKDRPQGFDEVAHVAAGLEWIDKGTYTIDRMHPPLSRDAIGLTLYLSGSRYPRVPAEDSGARNYNVVGNAILYGPGGYQHNLSLARAGVLPFFILSVAVVFFWSRREFGDIAAVMGVALFTTLPNVLAFSGLAYSDMAAAATQSLCFFSLAVWLDKPTGRNALLAGIATGLAFLSKFTSLLFLPAVLVSLILCEWIISRNPPTVDRRWVAKAGMIVMIAIAVIWAGYGFSVGPVQQDMGVSPANMPSFQHFPAPLRNVARNLVIDNLRVPAPSLLRGIADAWALNQSPSDSYVLGRIEHGGSWYFFLVGIAVKSPLPFLILCVIGIGLAAQCATHRKWQPVAPTACVFAILLVTTGVKYDAGVRHVLAVFPLLAIGAGAACDYLWRVRWRGVRTGAVTLTLLFLCQAVSSFEARQDYVGYFNFLAGSDPSRTLLLGCDLDCGQDLYRLSADLRARKISNVKLAVWSSANLDQVGLPQFEILPPFEPTNGWIAISARSLRYGDVLHKSYPHNAFAWLERYQPVEKIGNTIDLYHVTDVAAKPQ